MTTSERISNRLPRFYKSWEEGSLIAFLLKSISRELDETDAGITELMRSHWVDTAVSKQLDELGSIVESKRMPNENDEHFRGHLKRAVEEYKGGGTVAVILEQLRSMIRNEEFQFFENPMTEASAQFAVKANDTWQLGSNSTQDEQPSISLMVDEEGEVSNPQISNEDTGESIMFKGKLKKGEQLLLKQNSALLGEKDVTNRVSTSEVPILPRKGAVWRYTEELLEKIGVFDTARFDDHTFAVGVPTVRVNFQWTRSQPATFMVQVKAETLKENDLSASVLQKSMDSLKAAGIKAIIKVTE
jgi:hypothetical protein